MIKFGVRILTKYVLFFKKKVKFKFEWDCWLNFVSSSYDKVLNFYTIFCSYLFYRTYEMLVFEEVIVCYHLQGHIEHLLKRMLE